MTVRSLFFSSLYHLHAPLVGYYSNGGLNCRDIKNPNTLTFILYRRRFVPGKKLTLTKESPYGGWPLEEPEAVFSRPEKSGEVREVGKPFIRLRDHL